MAEQKRVSGMTVGPFLSEEQHDAILETRERRKAASQQSTQKRDRGTSEKPQGTSATPQSKG